MHPQRIENVYEGLEIKMRDGSLLPEPSLIHWSSSLGYFIRGGRSMKMPSATTHSIIHPGLFISIVLSGNALAGPGRQNLIADYADNSFVAIAVRETSDWFSLTMDSPMMQGLGVAFPLSSLARLKLNDEFANLFGKGDSFRVARMAVSPRMQSLAEEALLNPASDVLQNLLLDAHAMEIMVRAMSALKGETYLRFDTRDRQRMRRVCDCIESDLSRNWTMAELAQHSGVSVRSLSSHFKQAFGSSVIDYVRRRKLEAARETLLYQRVSVAVVSRRFGYGSPYNFSTAFRRQFGEAPGALARMSAREIDQNPAGCVPISRGFSD